MNKQLLVEIFLIGAVFVATGVAFYLFRRVGAAERLEELLTGLLGGFLLMAGTVKFFEPFTTLFATQIALSELPFPVLSKWAGQLGEILAGGMFLTLLIAGKKRLAAVADILLYGASLLTTFIMLVAIHVHLLPGVPAAVLPLQSKPPVLTLIVLALVVGNALLYRRKRQLNPRPS